MANDSGTIEGGQDNSILGDFWPNFNVDGPYFDVEEAAQVGDSLAVFVLNQYNIPYIGSKGGSLGSIDIKRMDAMTVINQSLMEEITSGYIVEAIVDEFGQVEFVNIGESGGGISDVYFTVQTHQYTETAKGVMITGAKPLPTRNKVEWKPIWGEGEDSSFHIYTYVDMLNNCNLPAFSRYATITFNDPYLDSTYNDGIDNLFDITDPWNNLLGYVYWKDIPPELVEGNNEYTINYTKSATVPVKVGADDNFFAEGPITLVEQVAFLGTELQTLPQYDADATPEECWTDPNQGTAVDFSKGVEVPIRDQEFKDLIYDSVRGTTVDKFVKVSEVYVLGIEVEYCKSAPANDAEAKKASNGLGYEYKVWVSVDDRQRKAFKLTEKRNYAVAYDEEEFKTPYIVFAKDIRPDDPAEYGTATEFFLDQGCKVAREAAPGQEISGKFVGSILPMDRNRAILVEEIWVLIELDSPSIIVNDPNGNAVGIAEGLSYYLGAMKMRKEPAPIGYAGRSATAGTTVDQTTGVQDNDPTTAIDYEKISEIDKYYDEMQGGGMALTLSFLDEEQVAEVAAILYEYMTYNGVATVHTCGPCARPKLGRWGTTGVINSIQYSYSDKGSYTISVQEGPYVVGGLAAVDGGPTQKMAEDHQAQGRIIKDVGNGIHFKVAIDGFGERWALSTIPSILRVGDIVSVTVHNNPVEA